MAKSKKVATIHIPITAKEQLAQELGHGVMELDSELKETLRASKGKERAHSCKSPPQRTDFEGAEEFQLAQTAYTVERTNEQGCIRFCSTCSSQGIFPKKAHLVPHLTRGHHKLKKDDAQASVGENAIFVTKPPGHRRVRAGKPKPKAVLKCDG